MNRACIVVASAGGARFYGVEASDSARSKSRLVEQVALNGHPDLRTLGESVTGRVHTETNTNRQAGPMPPMEAQRERHRGELDRRFGREVARQAGELTAEWKRGTIVLVAEPRMLGLLREPVRAALHPGIELKELAKDYTNLPVAELHEHLALNRLIPVHRNAAQ